MTEGLDVRTDAGVLRLRIDRPEHLNAMTAPITDRLAEELEAAAARDDVRVVLLTGTGAAFSAGADVSGTDAHEGFDVTSLDRANRLVRAVVSLDKPVVAAVNGVAAGVGCSLAVACDLVVAAESARFVLAFSRIGLMPDGGATATVAAAVGRVRAMRLALLGDALSAREAYDAGLASLVVPDADFPDAVEETRRAPRGRTPARLRRHQEGRQRGHARPPRGRPAARAHRPDDPAAHRRRRGGDAGVRREACADVPRALRGHFVRDTPADPVGEWPLALSRWRGRRGTSRARGGPA